MVLIQVVILQAAAYFQSCSALPMLMRLFPKSHFGHLCSARSLMSSVVVLFTSMLLGVLLDYLKINLNLGNYAYRFCYIWQTFFIALGAVFYLCGYREFIKLGGFKGYRAPAPWSEKGYEEMTSTPVTLPSKKLITISLWIVTFAMLLPIAAAGGFFVYCMKLDMASEAAKFLYYTLPAAVIALVLWGLLAIRILRDCALVKVGKTPANGIPHHGLLILLGGTRLALTLMACAQCFWVIKAKAPASPAWMLVFECFVAVIFTLLIWVYTKVERGSAAEIAK
jgi:hypothetical protein